MQHLENWNNTIHGYKFITNMSNSFFSALLRKHLVDFGLHRFGSWIIDFLPILIVEMHILDNKAGLSDLFAIY